MSAPAPDVEDMDTRWRAWQARGRDDDRRRRVAVRRLIAVVALLAAGWWVSGLV